MNSYYSYYLLEIYEILNESAKNLQKIAVPMPILLMFAYADSC